MLLQPMGLGALGHIWETMWEDPPQTVLFQPQSGALSTDESDGRIGLQRGSNGEEAGRPVGSPGLSSSIQPRYGASAQLTLRRSPRLM